MKHPCCTHDVSSVLMFYIPFYASLFASSLFYEYNLTRRDAMAMDLVDLILKFLTFPPAQQSGSLFGEWTCGLGFPTVPQPERGGILSLQQFS